MSAQRADANGHWVIDHVEPQTRFEIQGQIVRAGDPVLIRHVQTNVYLGSDSNCKVKNDFGAENEVHCDNHSTLNKSQNLWLEKEGRVTVDVPTKFQHVNNVFFLQCSPDHSYARPIEDLSKVDIKDVLKDIKMKICDKSLYGLRKLCRIYSSMDDGSHNLDVDDFRWGLIDLGIQVSKDEAQEICNNFDRDGCGKVHFDEFLKCLKGNMNATRMDCVNKAFAKLNANGFVKLDDVAQNFDVTAHPEVLNDQKTERDVFMEFMSLW